MNTPRSLAELLRGSESDPAFLIVALLAAFLFGAAHALTPGHGKTIVAAYLVGSRGRLLDAFYLGGIVTATHTASVFVLGMLTLYASTRYTPDQILPWLSLLSGALVFAIGAWLFFQRVRAAALESARPCARPASHSHSHSSLVSLGVSGGLVPCPEALVVLMMSISLGRVLFGLLLLTAFSLGLAAVLIAIGSAMVLAGGKLDTSAGGSLWVRRLPILTAAMVAALGAWMTLDALRKIHG